MGAIECKRITRISAYLDSVLNYMYRIEWRKKKKVGMRLVQCSTSTHKVRTKWVRAMEVRKRE